MVQTQGQENLAFTLPKMAAIWRNHLDAVTEMIGEDDDFDLSWLVAPIGPFGAV